MRIVIKVGTSTLAYENTGLLHIRRMKQLCEVLSDIKNAGHEVILVSSGAIGMGMGKLGLNSKPHDLPGKQACAAIGQCELMYTYDSLFSQYNHIVGQILITKADIENEDRKTNFINTMEHLLKRNVLPIVNENDTIATEEIVIGDNDNLGAILAKNIHADLYVILSDIDGLYDDDPHKNENAKLIAKVEKSNVCDDSIVNIRNDNASLIAKIDMSNESLASLKIENEKLIAKAKYLNVCNVSISNLRYENAILHAKIDELNACKPSTSTIEYVTICTRCRDINVDAIHDHIALIKQQNDHIAQLTAKINEHELENEKFKFARSMLYNGRRPGIKDGIGFQRGDNVKLNAPPKRLSNFVKGKAPMPQDNEGYILYPAGYPEDKIRKIHSRKSHSGPNHAFMYKGETSSSRQPTCAKLPKRKTPNASNDHDISFKTFDASYVLTNKSGKVVAKYVGGKHKGSKTCVWVPKVLVSNAKGPKTIWVPKVKN